MNHSINDSMRRSIKEEYQSPVAAFDALREKFGDQFDAIKDVDAFMSDLRDEDPVPAVSEYHS